MFQTLAATAAKSLQSCPTLCDPTDGSPPGSPVPGILQARTLEWVAISSSNAWKWKVKVKSLSRVGLLATPWTAAYQAPPSMGFSRREDWSGVPLPSPSIHARMVKRRKLTSVSEGSNWTSPTLLVKSTNWYHHVGIMFGNIHTRWTCMYFLWLSNSSSKYIPNRNMFSKIYILKCSH